MIRTTQALTAEDVKYLNRYTARYIDSVCTLIDLEESRKAAQLAVKAAQGHYTWGRWAAQRFAVKNEVDSRLLRLALRLEMEDRERNRKVAYLPSFLKSQAS